MHRRKSAPFGRQAAALLLLLLLTACRQPAPTAVLPAQSLPALPQEEQSATALPVPPTATAPSALPSPPIPQATATLTAEIMPTPYFSGPPTPPCGQLLPLLPQAAAAPLNNIAVDPEVLESIRSMMPPAALPALQHMMAAPEDVGLVAYRVGQESEGVYLNADVAMPLASVVKIIHLVAYVEAVTSGQLDQLSSVPVAALEQYYLPGLDLGAHPRALEELEENGRLFATPPQMLLQEVPWMMIRHSSNAATDYLHMLLGQERIEATAVALGLGSQTAPCPFLGQFLAMSNHTRQGIDDMAAIRAFIESPSTYGREVMLLTDGFSRNDLFREAEIAWRTQERRSSFSIQQFFTANLNAHGSARDYAALMARIAQNGLSNGESSFLARRYLEWPMLFPANQEVFSNLGYKNGSLPGVLTTVYYAYPSGQTTPVVVALFFRDLPRQTYRQWRSTLPHDELARWLLAEPQAIPALRALLNP